MHNAYRHPNNNLLGYFLNGLLNNRTILRFRRSIFSRLPFLKLKSDVTDVVYLNWLVDSQTAAAYLPKGVKLEQRNGKTIFTILTYRHHHFGPALTGRLRRFFPSPLQSNWRFYPSDIPHLPKANSTVLFIKNMIDSTLFAAGSRLFSDSLPSHLTKSFVHEKQGPRYITYISSGAGSAEALECIAEETQNWQMPDAFLDWFTDKDEALQKLCLQHSAIAAIDGEKELAFAGIHLPINITTIKPLNVNKLCIPFLQQLDQNSSDVFAFVVPFIPFDVLWEKILCENHEKIST